MSLRSCESLALGVTDRVVGPGAARGADARAQPHRPRRRKSVGPFRASGGSAFPRAVPLRSSYRAVMAGDSSGTERPMAVLYVNMREFNDLSARKLPYDVVFMLNQFFAALATAVRQAGGSVDKFVGDGIVAVFGQKAGLETGCRQALRAMRSIDLALDHLNSEIAAELGDRKSGV